MHDGAVISEEALRARLEALRQEHRDLDAAIEALMSSSGYDQLRLQRLKKRRLYLRDQIRLIEDQLLPDIIA
ncbi:MAG: DUF465 domain-containing protein [Alphaproteobacteria bacterium]|nr:MAG: DUF465 domain-containing protein [Alphaproteobacteria bacterium]